MKRRFRGGQQRANVSWYKLAAQKLTPALCRATFRTKAFYTARAANAAHHAASKKLFSKCLVEDAVVRHHGEPDHNRNKRYLRADAQNDIVFDPLVGMNPAMKSLKGPQRFIRQVGVNSVEGSGQYGPEGAE